MNYSWLQKILTNKIDYSNQMEINQNLDQIFINTTELLDSLINDYSNHNLNKNDLLKENIINLILNIFQFNIIVDDSIIYNSNKDLEINGLKNIDLINNIITNINHILNQNKYLEINLFELLIDLEIINYKYKLDIKNILINELKKEINKYILEKEHEILIRFGVLLGKVNNSEKIKLLFKIITDQLLKIKTIDITIYIDILDNVINYINENNYLNIHINQSLKDVD